ncbi:MAG: SDR family NAD(P)-dependent oxidoreductase [Shimia sp.]|uniref:SDR family NAD(P)-dependent oxidoreductase n=1 Tax=Shimia sp. TaxID=1954381 RepID=UPI001B0A46CD|nr:SDR family NAD(P)-dependent oxidoreductase [Shimia sp.]MBO6897363.1 SDR family NAD(P)-dependent oxidoreductase [Shimia sp.]
MPYFAHHSILVTGATGGIGRALTHALTEAGALVIATGRSAKALDRLTDVPADTLKKIQAVLSHAEGRDALLAQIQRYQISGIIHAAGVQFSQNIPEGLAKHPRQSELELALNLQAPEHLTSALLPTLAQHPKPFVSAITSSLALAPKRDAPTYCATKAGLRHYLRALRYQCADAIPQLLVNEVLPALVDTPMTAGRGTGKDSPEKVATEILRGLVDQKSETWIGKARLLRGINRVSPSLAVRILR